MSIFEKLSKFMIRRISKRDYAETLSNKFNEGMKSGSDLSILVSEIEDADIDDPYIRMALVNILCHPDATYDNPVCRAIMDSDFDFLSEITVPYAAQSVFHYPLIEIARRSSMDIFKRTMDKVSIPFDTDLGYAFLKSLIYARNGMGGEKLEYILPFLATFIKKLPDGTDYSIPILPNSKIVDRYSVSHLLCQIGTPEILDKWIRLLGPQELEKISLRGLDCCQVAATNLNINMLEHFFKNGFMRKMAARPSSLSPACVLVLPYMQEEFIRDFFRDFDITELINTQNDPILTFCMNECASIDVFDFHPEIRRGDNEALILSNSIRFAPKLLPLLCKHGWDIFKECETESGLKSALDLVYEMSGLSYQYKVGSFTFLLSTFPADLTFRFPRDSGQETGTMAEYIELLMNNFPDSPQKNHDWNILKSNIHSIREAIDMEEHISQPSKVAPRRKI